MAKNKNPWEDDGSWGSSPKSEKTPKVTNIEDFNNKSPKKNGGSIQFEWKVKWIVFALIAIWLASGFYQIEPNEQGVVTRFGSYINTTDSGLHYRLPYPIENIVKVNQTQERSFTLGVSGNGGGNKLSSNSNRYQISNASSTTYDNFTESHMLTGDENIVDINLTIVWKVKDSKGYLFSLREPDQTVYVAAQSVLREIVGQSQMMEIITGDRGKVEEDTKRELQALLDEFQSGVEIVRVRLQKADPPQQVVDAFNEVQRARADMVKFQNQAEAYSNEVLPQARGQAVEITNAAEAYKERVINEAKGETERFQNVYNAYKLGKDVTATRMYLDAIGEVMDKSNKVIIDPSAKGSNVLPLLPLKQ